MTLPGGIDSAKALQTRTGWPRPLCRRFVKRVDRWYRWRDSLVWAAIGVAAPLIGLAPVAAIFIAMDGPPLGWRLTIYISVGAVVIAAEIGAYLWRRRARLYRVLARFRAEPWCLKYRYPIPPVEEGEAVCPECGEPVPPQIAELVGRPATG